MRNKALIVVLVGAVIFGLIAAVSVSRFLTQLRGSGKLGNVVIAKSEIPQGEKINADQLTTVQLPSAVMPEGGYDSPEKVVGRVAGARITPREMITQSKLAPLGATAGLSALIPEGYRAMTVKVEDEAEVAGFLTPGTQVDVLAVINSQNGGAGQSPISKIILQNIKVLAGGLDPDQPKTGRVSRSAKSVTLLVTPEQAEKLVLSSFDGKLRLALRNSVDRVDELTPGADKRALLSDARLFPTPDAGGPIKEKRPQRPQQSRSLVRPILARLAIPAAVPEAPPVATPAPTPARPRVEIYEGAKKKAVEFP